MPSDTSYNPPPSATSSMTGLLGLVVMIAAAFLMKDVQIALHLKTLAIIGAGAIAMIGYEFLFSRTYLRETTGLDWRQWRPDFKRSAIKLMGLFLTITFLASLYILFPEYEKGLYRIAWQTFRDVLPYAAVFAVLYVFVVDGAMKTPEDGYYHAGLIALGRIDKADLSRMPHHIRSWLIKGFFIPLMFCYLTQNIGGLSGHINTLDETIRTLDMIRIFGVLWALLITIDLSFTVIGYLFSFRVTDTHERSAEPTMLGWVVALMCYQPFWGLFGKNYLDYQGTKPNWDIFFAEYPVLITIWGITTILLTIVYTWSTVAFGMRFSNLTHRGIITSGPYRFTKHPAYISKNLTWWLISAPFMALAEDTSAALQNCVLLLMLNGVYYLRAVTEERHLSQDPVYRDYQAWIAAHGIFRKWNISSLKKL